MKTKRERYINEGAVSLIYAVSTLRRSLDGIEYARKLIESADDSLGDVLDYKNEVFERIDYVTRQVRAIEADVRQMITEAGK